MRSRASAAASRRANYKRIGSGDIDHSVAPLHRNGTKPFCVDATSACCHELCNFAGFLWEAGLALICKSSKPLAIFRSRCRCSVPVEYVRSKLADAENAEALCSASP